MGSNDFDFIRLIRARCLLVITIVLPGEPHFTTVCLTTRSSARYVPKPVMKRIFASVFVAVVSLPLAAFACGGGDCSMDLPPPRVPAPGPVENLLSTLADHTGLFAGLALAAIVGYAVSRQRKLLATKSATPLGSPAS
jgi:hypothetical protein